MLMGSTAMVLKAGHHLLNSRDSHHLVVVAQTPSQSKAWINGEGNANQSPTRSNKLLTHSSWDVVAHW